MFGRENGTVRPDLPDWVAQAVMRRRDLTGWMLPAGIVVLLAVSWAAVYIAGGSRTALPHVFYVPVLLAAVLYGIRGGLVAAALSGVLCGPLMPLNAVTGQPQGLTNWLARAAFFLVVGLVAGAATVALRRSFERGLASRFTRELDTLDAETRTVGLDADFERRIRAVLEHRSFHPVFQPIYSLEDGRLIAAEALTRFDTDPPRPPDRWFAEAARAGLGVDLELAALQAALEGCRVGLPEDVMVTANVSCDTLLHPHLLERLDALLRRRLMLELTEHAVVDDYHQVTAALDRLRRINIRFAVDDAGAGFASLRHIVRLTPDYIKLDVSLTQGLRSDPIRRALAESLVGFANRTDVTLIAEGIEKHEDLDAWRDLGAHAAQGYLLGRPGPLPVDTHCPLLAEQAHAA